MCSVAATSVSSAGPSEPCARAVGTDDGDLSEPILACVCVRVGGDRGAAVAAAATPPVSATLGEPLDVPPAVALGGAQRSPPLLVMQGTSRVWVRAQLRHHGTMVRACTASSDDARMREHVGGKVGACATAAEHRLKPRSGATAIAAGASRGPGKAVVRPDPCKGAQQWRPSSSVPPTLPPVALDMPRRRRAAAVGGCRPDPTPPPTRPAAGPRAPAAHTPPIAAGHLESGGRLLKGRGAGGEGTA